MNFWPPLVGAGIRIDYIHPEYKQIDVSMKLHWWNANYVRTHFGGGMYMMADPFFMYMLVKILGENYIVWDKEATIRFLKPGRGTIRAHFELTDEQISNLKSSLSERDKITPTFTVKIVDSKNEVICEVDKKLYIRKKKDYSVLK